MVLSFRTFMTGELFDVLARHSLLRHSVDPSAWDEGSFASAVELGMRDPGTISAHLFSIRSESLLLELGPAAAAARLSGLLIGAELASVRHLRSGGESRRPRVRQRRLRVPLGTAGRRRGVPAPGRRTGGSRRARACPPPARPGRLMRNLMAILRGLRPGSAASVGECLIERGFGIVEVPLNSPEPYTSISVLVREFGKDALIGAGTVLSVKDVQKAADCGSRIIVSPNTDPAVIAETARLGMQSWPGAFTPTECLSALDAGADGIKLFPADLAGPAGAGALKAVLPQGTRIRAVGGGDPAHFASWFDAGVEGFGIGSNLFRQDLPLEEIGNRAVGIVRAYDLAAEGRAQ